MYTRNEYLDRIAPFIGKPVIKVITGLRRSGKSCLLQQIAQRLRERHRAAAEDIVAIDKESLEFHLALIGASARTGADGLLAQFQDPGGRGALGREQNAPMGFGKGNIDPVIDRAMECQRGGEQCLTRRLDNIERGIEVKHGDVFREGSLDLFPADRCPQDIGELLIVQSGNHRVNRACENPLLP